MTKNQLIRDFKKTRLNDACFNEWLIDGGWKGESQLHGNFVLYTRPNGHVIAIKQQKVQYREIYIYEESYKKTTTPLYIKPMEVLHTPTLTEIIKHDADFVTNSGYRLTYDYIYSWIALDTKDGMDDNAIFFQNEEADNLLEKAKKLYEETGDTFLDDCIMHCLKGWVENMI